MLSRKDQEYAMIDASRYLSEMKREALTTIVPHPEDKEARIDLITVLRGRRPNLNQLFLASVEEHGWKAMSRGENPNLEGIEAVSFIRSHAPSLDALRSKQVVEIAKSEPRETSQSIIDVLRRGKK